MKFLTLILALNKYVIALTVVILPLFLLPFTTDAIETPKQLLLVSVTLLLLFLFGLKTVLEGKFTFRRTPFDLPLFILAFTIIASLFFASSTSSALISAIPMLAAILLFFLIINNLEGQDKKFLLSGFLLGGVLVGIFTILQFSKVYLLPYPIAKNPAFSLAGSLLTTVIFLIALLPMAIAGAKSGLASQKRLTGILSVSAAIVIAVAVTISLYQLVTTARPLLLPQETGLRTALQPLGTNFQTALFGTGPGSYLFNFTRFKDAAINSSDLWNSRFSNSSSFFLEVLSTLGIVGAITLIFLIFRLLSSFFKNGRHERETVGVFLSMILLFLFAFFLPFSFLTFSLIFILLALYGLCLSVENNPQVFDLTISMVALKKGFLAVTPAREVRSDQDSSDLLPFTVLGIIILVVLVVLLGIPGKKTSLTRFMYADVNMQQSLVEWQNNKAKETYDLQNQALNTFTNRDSYHRLFSQTNLAIATFKAQQIKTATEAAAVSDQDRRDLTQLVQQAINFGRNAVALSPLNVANWENLANVYRNIIGFAQDADQFAIASTQQAVALDPANPLLRIALGGIYLQLNQQEAAISQFQIAVNLKPDLANAHYNLGHAWENKGDSDSLKLALSEYQTVRNLLPRGSDEFKKIEEEIAVLANKIPAPEQATPSARPQVTTQQQPLQISTPSSTLPPQKEPIEVEGPPTATESGSR
ncbi:tetratricopeptide repeat protein [Candidatus Microgenomates bacterium]|nr:tetratricopeptide repeat protein [Candidatus Microgenomates bacterium]